MGVPYTLGIGLYGPPGTGKTSLIKCLAKYLDRHVVTLSMKMFKTRKQLNEFYYEMRYNNANPKDSITFDKKIIVMEDIDCLGDIVLKRPDTEPIKLDRKGTLKVNELKNVEKEDANDNKLQTAMKNILVEDPITLDDILNIWDGVRETPGRVLIISSNHYDKLDPALTRPGRIDIAMEMSHASRQTIVQMYEHFFKCSLKPTQMKLIPDKKYTPAEVMNMYIRSSFSPEQFLKLLSQKSK
jgi:SpoVK/Ycf46/Vps4 family AAA+-type ATPase